jgi:hypothetical protein
MPVQRERVSEFEEHLCSTPAHLASDSKKCASHSVLTVAMLRWLAEPCTGRQHKNMDKQMTLLLVLRSRLEGPSLVVAERTT